MIQFFKKSINITTLVLLPIALFSVFIGNTEHSFAQTSAQRTVFDLPYNSVAECEVLPEDTVPQKTEKALCFKKFALLNDDINLCHKSFSLDRNAQYNCYTNLSFRSNFIRICQNRYNPSVDACKNLLPLCGEVEIDGETSMNQCLNTISANSVQAQKFAPDYFTTRYFIGECEGRFTSPQEESCKQYVSFCPFTAAGSININQCYDTIAQKINNASWCYSDDCRTTFFSKTGSFNSCSSLAQKEQHWSYEKRNQRRDECLLEITTNIRNPEICEAIQDPVLKQTCFNKLESKAAQTSWNQILPYILFIFLTLSTFGALALSYRQAKNHVFQADNQVFGPSVWKYIVWGLAAFVLFSVKVAIEENIFPLPHLPGVSPGHSFSLANMLFSSFWQYGRYILTTLILVFTARKIFVNTSITIAVGQIKTLSFWTILGFIISTFSIGLVWFIFAGALSSTRLNNDTIGWIVIGLVNLLPQLVIETVTLLTTIGITHLIIIAARKNNWISIFAKKVPYLALASIGVMLALFLVQFAQHQSSCGTYAPDLIPTQIGHRDTAHCLATKAFTANNPYLCELSDARNASYCYTDLAIVKKDTTLCSNIPDEVFDQRDGCIKWVNEKK